MCDDEIHILVRRLGHISRHEINVVVCVHRIIFARSVSDYKCMNLFDRFMTF